MYPIKANITAFSAVAGLMLAGTAYAGIFNEDSLGTVAPPPAPEPEPYVEIPAVPVATPGVPVALPVAVPVATPAVPVAIPVPTPVATPAIPVAVPVPTPSATPTVAVPESVLLGPSAEDSSDPKRLLHVFCQAWKDGDWKKVWYCMEPSYRNKHSFDAFVRRFKDDAELTGGLDDETIAPAPRVQGSKQTFDVTLSFENAPIVRPRKVKASLKTTPDGYRIVESTILPPDLNDM